MTNSKNAVSKSSSRTMAPTFMYACALPLFDMEKATTPNRINGNRYAINPNNPNITDETASPAIPPRPKLLITSRIQTANTASIKISSLRAVFSCFFVLRPVVFLFFVDFAAIILPPWYLHILYLVYHYLKSMSLLNFSHSKISGIKL